MKFYVIKHSDNQYSIQSEPNGGGYLVETPHNITEQQAQLYCDCANDVVKIMEHKQQFPGV